MTMTTPNPDPVSDGQTMPATGAANSAGNGTTGHAGSAAGSCRQAETAVGASAATHAGRPHTGNGNERQRPNPDTDGRRGGVTPTNTKRHGGQSVTVKSCQHCGRPYETKRPSQSKYCSSICRRAAWLARRPERVRQLAVSDKARWREWRQARGLPWEER